MAKKKSGSSAASLSRELAQIQANATIQAQQIANQATEKSFQYNAQEAATARQFNKEEAAVQRQFNSQEAKVARDWEERMSNTSHQREVVDLKKAGLNPVLSANGGAQSYTTSSASANAASATPASAYAYDASGTIGQLASTMMQGKIGAYEADTSAKATRYAAKQSAAATRYAAAAQASAAKYAAAMNYQNQREHEKWQNDYLEKTKQAKIEIIEHTPVNSIGGVLDKFATKAGLYDYAGTKAVQGTKNATMKLLNNSDKYFKNDGKVTAKNFALSKAGKALVNMQLARFGLEVTKKNQLAFVYSFVFNKLKWQNYLATKIRIRRYQSSLR